MTPLFGPGWGNYAIKGIVEVAEPLGVSLLPQTPGWYVLAVALLIVVALRIRQRRQRWKANAYRREALAELQRLSQRIEGGDDTAARELAPLLRATALHATERAAVAATEGDAWQAQLAQLAPRCDPLPVDTLHQLAYASGTDTAQGLPAAELQSLLQRLEHWIAAHRGPGD